MMQYGCIGKNLIHSFSKELHAIIGDYSYELCNILEKDLVSFLNNKEFKGINVTIPYKQAVIPYLDEIDPHAKSIGAVNTIIHQNGKLIGYNTDYLGFSALIEPYLDLLHKSNCYILGTGGTSKTVQSVLKDIHVKSIQLVSRNKGEIAMDYIELEKDANNVDVLINTTPCGMYPNFEELPITLKDFKNCKCVIDVVYHPLQTSLILQAKELGIEAVGGLKMLAYQAIYASELFFHKKYEEDIFQRVYQTFLHEKQNIVLIGMPTCGKTMFGRYLSQELKKPFLDTDEEFQKFYSLEPKDYLQKYGEKDFREKECQIIESISNQNGIIIATGGGVVLNPCNVTKLKQNGCFVFLDKAPEYLQIKEDRPLSNTKEKLQALYIERYPIYQKVADYTIKCTNEPIEEMYKIFQNEYQ